MVAVQATRQDEGVRGQYGRREITRMFATLSTANVWARFMRTAGYAVEIMGEATR